MIPILTYEECKNSFDQYLHIRDTTKKSNDKLSSGKNNNPKLSSDVSESLTAKSIMNGELLKRWGQLINVKRHKNPDIIADDKLIQVKATVEDFITYTKTDSNCDVLIWLDFSYLVKENKPIIPASCFYNPANHIPTGKDRIIYDDMSGYYEISDGEFEIIESICFPGYTEYNPKNRQISDDTWKLFFG